MKRALLVFALAALVVKAPGLLVPMGQDQGLYHAIGLEILHGAVPYRDAWDPKPPGVFYVHAAVLAPLGNDPWRVCQVGSLQPRCGSLVFGLTDFLYSLLLAWLVLRLADRVGLSRPAQVLAFGYTAVFANLAVLDAEGSTPEKYALLPAVGVLLAFLAFDRSRNVRWLILCGVLAGAAALLKPTDLASFGAVSLTLAINRRWRELLAAWIALIVVVAVPAAVLVVQGAGGQALDAVLGYNTARAGFNAAHIPVAFAQGSWQLFRDGLALLWLPAVLGIVLAWQHRPWRLLATWAALDVLALFAGGDKFTREYFLQLVPSCAILAALGLHALWARAQGDAAQRLWIGLSCMAIGLLTSGFQSGFSQRIWNEYVAHGWTTTSSEHLASMVMGLPAANRLFVWGDEAQIYTLSYSVPTTRFLNTAGLAVTGDPRVAARRREVWTALQASPPAVIVIDRRSGDDDPEGRLLLNILFVPELTDLLAAHYREMDPAILAAYLGGDREQVYVRGPDVCAQMPGCRLRAPT